MIEEVLSMILRPARESDVQELLDIFNYEVEHSRATFSLRPRTFEERMQWFHEHSGGAHPLIVSEEDGRVTGYASLSVYRANDAYARTVELSIYVHHEYRGRKIGDALMKEILDIARREEGVHTVISVITSENLPSIRLHRKFGFTYCGTMKEVGLKFGRWMDIDNYQLIV